MHFLRVLPSRRFPGSPWLTLLVPLWVAASVGCSNTDAIVGADTGADVGPVGDTGPLTDGTAPMDAPRDASVDAPADVPFRCATNADCAGNPAGAVCDPTAGQCVQCLASADTCPAAQHCDATTRACIAGCRADDGCTGAGTDGGTVTDGGVALLHCDTTAHACVACVTSDQCPPGNLCTGHTCVMGCDATHACPASQLCCTGSCVDTHTNTADCGGCGMACSLPNAMPVCTAGACAVGTCATGYGDCDLNPANGCETDVTHTVTQCGACGHACTAGAHATATCTAGACGLACATGYADCNGTASDGCESAMATDVTNCGACGMACAVPAHATATCTAGACGLACATGYGDCNGTASDGCEAALATTVTSCGACGHGCTAPAHATATCAAGACGFACATGYADCDGNPANGCEAATAMDPTHCGTCGTACAAAHGTAGCAAGACTVASCATGYADCDHLAGNGCETSTATDRANCGACGMACAATQVCSAGACSAPPSCAAILAAAPTSASAEYTIDPDGSGPVAPFTVYCDMTTEGGGWTLIGTAHNYPLTGSPTRRWNVESVFTDTTTFGTTAARSTDNFKSQAWSVLPATDLLVLTPEYDFGFRGLMGAQTMAHFISTNVQWTETACSTTWIRSGVDFASSSINATARATLGFTFRGTDANGGANPCFPGLGPSRAAGQNENAAISFLAGPGWWVWGWGNTPAGTSTWSPYDVSLFDLAVLNSNSMTCGPSSGLPNNWPCNASNHWMNGAAYDRSDKVRYAQFYVR